MGTAPEHGRVTNPGALERVSRRVRLFHAAAYLVTIPLLVTGWWIALGGEGHPSPLARLSGVADTTIHVWFGRVIAVLAVVPLVIGRRGVATFARDTFRRDPGDRAWWRRWPGAVFTGRFARHEGRFDPGQRVANVVIVCGLLVLIGTGIGMTTLHGGPTFAALDRIHRVATFVVTPVILGHVMIALGVLPGYRGAWRAMHLRGRVPLTTARRLWPGWTERSLASDGRRDDRPSAVERASGSAGS